MDGAGFPHYYAYWGKASREDSEKIGPFHLLLYHSLDVAAVGQTLLKEDSSLLGKFQDESTFSEAELLGYIPAFLALHDIGKFSDCFQSLRDDILSYLRKDAPILYYPVHHDDMGILLLEKIRRGIWEQKWFPRDQTTDIHDWWDIWNPWFQAVTGHHGFPPERQQHPDLFTPENLSAASAYVKDVLSFFLKDCHPISLQYSKEVLGYFKRTSWLLTGLATLADWIGSNSLFFPHNSDYIPVQDYWVNLACPQAVHAVRETGIHPHHIATATGVRHLFSYSSPTPLQEYVLQCAVPSEESSPCLYILEDVTGSGKTEAAITLAHRLMICGRGAGFYMGLPTMATANAMFSRLVPVYTRLYMHDEKPSIVLAHGSRHLSKEFLAVASSSLPGDASEYHQGDHTAEATSIAWLSDNRKKALLAPVGVGTIDQALMAVLPFRHQSLRLLGLCRNVLIVDEVHAYDRYMQVVLKELLEFTATFGGSAILLSATLPIAIKNELVQGFLQGLSSPGKIDLRNPGYPLVTSVTSSGIREDPLSSPQHQRRTIRIELIEMKSTDIQTPIERLSGIIQSGQCACWVRNTVDDAVEASKQLSALFGRENILLFHARFTLEDRLRIEKKVLSLFGKEYDRNGRKGKIVVATQVVEHSLDLDFDFMVTDLAPIDLIIQRSGRLHRHPDLHPTRGSPVLSVLIPPVTDSPGIDYYQHVFPRGAYVYPHHGQLWLTAKILKESGQIVVPDDFRPMIEAVYGKEAQTRIPQVLKEKEHRAIAEESGDAAIANLSLLKVREGYRRTPIHWQDELRTSTRLTEATVQVVLFKWMGNTLSFWSSDPDYPWDMSEVQVPARWITSSADDYPPGVAEALDSMLKKLPDEGQWRIPIVLFINEQGKWEGRAKNHEGQIIRVSYDSEIGLQILR